MADSKKIKIVKDEEKNLLVILVEPNEKVLRYQIDMIENNDSIKLLTPQIIDKDNKIVLEYDLNEYTEVFVDLDKVENKLDFILNRLYSINKVISNCEKYLLFQDCLLLNKDYLFQSSRNGQLFLFYIPIKRKKKSVKVYKGLILDILKCFDYDADEFKYIQRLTELLKRDDFSVKTFEIFLEEILGEIKKIKFQPEIEENEFSNEEKKEYDESCKQKDNNETKSELNNQNDTKFNSKKDLDFKSDKIEAKYTKITFDKKVNSNKDDKEKLESEIKKEEIKEKSSDKEEAVKEKSSDKEEAVKEKSSDKEEDKKDEKRRKKKIITTGKQLSQKITKIKSDKDKTNDEQEEEPTVNITREFDFPKSKKFKFKLSVLPLIIGLVIQNIIIVAVIILSKNQSFLDLMENDLMEKKLAAVLLILCISIILWIGLLIFDNVIYKKNNLVMSKYDIWNIPNPGELDGLLNDEKYKEKLSDFVTLNFNNYYEFPYLETEYSGTYERIFITKPVFSIGNIFDKSDYVIKIEGYDDLFMKILKNGNGYYILDLSKDNDIFINDEKLITKDKVSIVNKDKIKFAGKEFTFNLS